VPGTPTETYSWEVFDNEDNSKIAQLDTTATDMFIYAFPYVGSFKVKLTVVDGVGATCSVEKDYTLEECPVTVGGGGGAVPTGDWEQKYEEPDCEVRIIKVYFEDTEPLPEVKLKIRGGVKFD